MSFCGTRYDFMIKYVKKIFNGHFEFEFSGTLKIKLYGFQKLFVQ